MNMKKPEMKIMRFVNEDVIATSGATPPAFELRGFYDGKSNNLETYVDGIKYNGGNALKDALDNKYGGNGYNSLRLYYYVGETLNNVTLDILRFNQGTSWDNNRGIGVDKANGEYEWSRSDNENYTIYFTQIKNTQ